jgi:hypothetical protein
MGNNVNQQGRRRPSLSGKVLLGIVGIFLPMPCFTVTAGTNKRSGKMAREVVLMDIDTSGCQDAKSEIKSKGGKK